MWPPATMLDVSKYEKDMNRPTGDLFIAVLGTFFWIMSA